VTKAKDARNRLSDLQDALNQLSQALTVQLPPDVAASFQRFADCHLAPISLGEGLTPDVVAGLQRMNDDFNAVGARLAPDIVAFFERIDLAGLAPPQDLQAESLPLARHPGQRRGRPQGPQEHRSVAPEQSKCKAMEAELDSILESAGAQTWGRLPEERTRLARQFACAPGGLGLTEAQFEDMTVPEFIAAGRRWQRERLKKSGKPKGRPRSARTLNILSEHDKLGSPAINNKVCAEIAKKLKPEPKTQKARAKLNKQIYATLYRHRKSISSTT
jgi:hypothetical protein